MPIRALLIGILLAFTSARVYAEGLLFEQPSCCAVPGAPADTPTPTVTDTATATATNTATPTPVPATATATATATYTPTGSCEANFLPTTSDQIANGGTHPWTGSTTSVAAIYLPSTSGGTYLHRMYQMDKASLSEPCFPIPNGAVIDGIEVTLAWTDSTNSGSSTVVQLLDSGNNLVGTNKSTGSIPGSGGGTVTYGSPSDTWGTGWTGADINALNWGLAVQATASSPGPSPDNVAVSVNINPDSLAGGGITIWWH